MRRNVIFTENQLSTTIVEYTATSGTSWSYIYGSMLSLLLTFLLLSVWKRWQSIFLVSLVALVLVLALARLSVKEESITVIANFGIQLRIKYVIGSDRSKFLDCDKLEGSLIHEYIKGSQVRYCLAFIIHGNDKMALVFDQLYPGFSALQSVYKSCQRGVK